MCGSFKHGFNFFQEMSPPPPRSDVTLYYDALSASTLRVLTALHEKKIDFEKKLIDPSKEEQIQPWFQEISGGTGRLPVLRHKEGGSCSVWDAVAIQEALPTELRIYFLRINPQFRI